MISALSEIHPFSYQMFVHFWYNAIVLAEISYSSILVATVKQSVWTQNSLNTQK